MANVVQRRAQDRDAILFICDFSPPRGAAPNLLDPARKLDADFISVAYNPGRSVRVSSTLAAHWIAENTGKDVVFTLATRDMNKLAAQSLLLGAALLGLENVVVVKGDPFTQRELAMVRDASDFTPTQLLGAISLMNRGLDYREGRLVSPTSFCIGATVDLERGIDDQASLTHKKIEAGAEFLLLQSLFDPGILLQFLETYAHRHGQSLSVPVFCGIQIIAPDSIAFGGVPGWVRQDLAKGRSGPDIALQVIQRFVGEGFRSIYLIPPILNGGRRDYYAAQIVLETFRG